MHKARTIAQWALDKQRNEADLGKRLKQAGIPLEFHGMTWGDYEADVKIKSSERLYDVLVDYGDHWTPEQRDGLVLLGPAGWGKTAGLAILQQTLDSKGAWTKYVPYAELVERRKQLIGLEQEAQRTDDWEEANKARYRLSFVETECDALFLDDVGKEYRAASGWSDDGLDRLLRKRSELGRPTFISSNLSFLDWNKYNSSMASFLYAVGEVIELTEGRDHRKALTSGQRRRRAAG